MFSNLPFSSDLYQSNAVTLNVHVQGISLKTFAEDSGLSKMFKPTSVSYDRNKKEFVATMEAHNYPFYGV